MRIASALTAAALAVLTTDARAAEVYEIDPSHTFAHFEVSHLGFSTTRGRFDDTTGSVALDVKNKTGSVNVTIRTASVSSGVPKLDEHLRADDFFDAENFPNITFVSDRFHFDGDRVTAVDGRLTILGQERPVTLTVTHFRCGEHPMRKVPMCGADAHTSIKRSDFGMDAYIPAVGDAVRLKIQVEAHAKP
jgi:polyisoprenoid-binding protein YceI